MHSRCQSPVRVTSFATNFSWPVKRAAWARPQTHCNAVSNGDPTDAGWDGSSGRMEYGLETFHPRYDDASKNHATFAIASSDTAISRMEPFSLLSARSQSGNVALMKSEIVD